MFNEKALGVTAVVSSALFCNLAWAEKQDCAAVYEYVKSQHRSDSIALPHTGSEMNSMFLTHQVCFRGEDVTGWVAGKGLEVTTGYNGLLKDSTVAIVTAHAPMDAGDDYPGGGSKSSLILVSVDPQSHRLVRTELMAEHLSNDPLKSFEDFRITGYDGFNRILYFQVPAWATSNAVYAFPVAPVITSGKVDVRYVGPGSIDWVMSDDGITRSRGDIGKVLIWQDKLLPGVGRQEFLYAYDASGKRLCRIDATLGDYRIRPKCLKD